LKNNFEKLQLQESLSTIPENDLRYHKNKNKIFYFQTKMLTAVLNHNVIKENLELL